MNVDIGVYGISGTVTHFLGSLIKAHYVVWIALEFFDEFSRDHDCRSCATHSCQRRNLAEIVRTGCFGEFYLMLHVNELREAST